MKRVPPTVAAAVLRLDELGGADSWTKFAMIGRFNAFRLVKARGLVEDVNETARRAAFAVDADFEAIWRTHPTCWRLTEAGRALVAELKATP